MDPIPRPQAFETASLQQAMKLEDDSEKFKDAMRHLRTLAKQTFLDLTLTWSEQDVIVKTSYIRNAVTTYPFFMTYERAWPVIVYAQRWLAVATHKRRARPSAPGSYRGSRRPQRVLEGPARQQMRERELEHWRSWAQKSAKESWKEKGANSHKNKKIANRDLRALLTLITTRHRSQNLGPLHDFWSLSFERLNKVLRPLVAVLRRMDKGREMKHIGEDTQHRSGKRRREMAGDDPPAKRSRREPFTLDDAESILRGHEQGKSKLKKFTVTVLKQLCEKNHTPVGATGKRGNTIKDDYLRALCKLSIGEPNDPLVQHNELKRPAMEDEKNKWTEHPAAVPWSGVKRKAVADGHSVKSSTEGDGRPVKRARLVQNKNSEDNQRITKTKSILVRLYMRPKDWKPACECKHDLLPNGDLDLRALAQRFGLPQGCRVIDPKNNHPFHEYIDGRLEAADVEDLINDGYLRVTVSISIFSAMPLLTSSTG
ncbi:hypothetical protein A0H81_12053 [Grifola frondosa]|uniref:Uncharacterized protein n=1 Tax=Grifola frondosa TaxID=5627 RepID=A0A1C7LTK6_GRIFR|nr:hypothetical protein A0H81_12053 [Grifola frondosa]